MAVARAILEDAGRVLVLTGAGIFAVDSLVGE